MNYLLELLIFLVTLSISVTIFVHYRYGYWKRRNVPYLKPIFPMGNNTSIFPKGISLGIISKYFYDEFTKMGCKIGGVFFGIDPQLVIVDPDVAKDILTSDFGYFVARGVYKTSSDPTTVNLFTQDGFEWRTARAKSTSLFTSAKMRKFLETMSKCADEMAASLEQNAIENSDVKMLEVMACFTTDVIGSAVLGLNCNSFKDPNAEFRNIGRQLFDEFTLMDTIKIFLTISFPKLCEKIGVSNIQPEVSEFFCRTVKDLVKYREDNNLIRSDFLQMLIDMKNSTNQLTMDEIIGQVFIFFSAGFETSSTTATLTLFELSQKPEIQNKLRSEIEECMEKNDNRITYDALMGMPYMNAVVEETLRKWPSVTTLTRVCTKDYTFRDSGITIQKNTNVIIPVLGFHRDSNYHPKPMEFDPERFMNKNSSYPGYLPFGEGPRMCIGMRFGQMQVKLGLLTILRKYQVYPSPKTSLPLEIDPDTFVLHTKQPIYLKLKKL
ncbi:cytochrome P450 6a8-like [Leptinotarsa decemlineata]|uniref:cytochrome P450 6a8-like n=1 Tax=Leptinotarsa decemlineata TaxID=7539 RepID=UPI000C252B11|nr:cytochrome P450 6a8-like [Leptinotarsa decemlineata]